VADFLRDPGLDAAGVAHGFGTRASPELAVLRPRQVHGIGVVWATPGAALGDADAVLTRSPGARVGVVTADCVPILVAAGAAVGAIHAGWRGLAAGVVEAGVAELARAVPGASIRAAIGPCIGGCCYEVDAPVLDALRVRYGDVLDAALAPARPGRALLDLGRVVAHALGRAGLAFEAISDAARACTRCDAARFHSFRRDGSAAGRLLHWIAAPA
jgi:YfiH family protein